MEDEDRQPLKGPLPIVELDQSLASVQPPVGDQGEDAPHEEYEVLDKSHLFDVGAAENDGEKGEHEPKLMFNGDVEVSDKGTVMLQPHVAHGHMKRGIGLRKVAK